MSCKQRNRERNKNFIGNEGMKKRLMHHSPKAMVIDFSFLAAGIRLIYPSEMERIVLIATSSAFRTLDDIMILHAPSKKVRQLFSRRLS